MGWFTIQYPASSHTLPAFCHSDPVRLAGLRAVDIVGDLAVYDFADMLVKRVVLVAGQFTGVVVDFTQAFGCVVVVAEFFIGAFFCGQLTIGGIG
jgi:hypothetical protein